MTYKLPDLPYSYEALEPHMSANTLRFHHDKHHKKYVDTFNELVKDASLDDRSLEAVIMETADNKSQKKLFNNAAQSWNHSFFWLCMSPDDKEPNQELLDQIKSDFGTLDDLKSKFVEAGVGQFGSGWAWLVWRDGKIAIEATANAENPMTSGGVPLLTCDVWEHAYYLDYQNRRPDFIETFFDHLVDWDLVHHRLVQAQSNSTTDAIPLAKAS